MRKIVDVNKDGAEYDQDVSDYNEDIDQIKQGLDNLGTSTDESNFGASTDELFKKASKEETGLSGLQQGLVADQIGKRMDVATAKDLTTFQSGEFQRNAKFAGELQTKVDNAARADEFAYGARFGDKQLSLTNQFEDSKFGRDVVIDIVCYRKHGHNESDEPAFTQPKIYRTIRNKKSTLNIYKDYLLERNEVNESDLEKITNGYISRLESEYNSLSEDSENPQISFKGASAQFQEDSYSYDIIPTGVSSQKLSQLGEKLVEIPKDFDANPKIKRMFLAKRAKATIEGGPFDWAHAEALAFATLLDSGFPVRLSGQDVRRGTFSHRHCVLYDSSTRERYVPLQNLGASQASFCAYNSLLSEAGVLGFDYGYNIMVPKMLICWEAQFGDFVNGAQVIIDPVYYTHLTLPTNREV